MAADSTSATEPSKFETTNRTSDTTATTPVANTGVWRVGCTRPNAVGTVLSRPMANSERLTWMSVVSRVAIVESMTAMINSLPPEPGQDDLAETGQHVPRVALDLRR